MFLIVNCLWRQTLGAHSETLFHVVLAKKDASFSLEMRYICKPNKFLSYLASTNARYLADSACSDSCSCRSPKCSPYRYMAALVEPLNVIITYIPSLDVEFYTVFTLLFLVFLNFTFTDRWRFYDSSWNNGAKWCCWCSDWRARSSIVRRRKHVDVTSNIRAMMSIFAVFPGYRLRLWPQWYVTSILSSHKLSYSESIWVKGAIINLKDCS